MSLQFIIKSIHANVCMREDLRTLFFKQLLQRDNNHNYLFNITTEFSESYDVIRISNTQLDKEEAQDNACASSLLVCGNSAKASIRD